MNKALAMILATSIAASTASAETIFEAKGPVTDKTPGFRFGNITFTDNDRVCAKFEAVEMTDGAKGRLTTDKLRLPNKEQGKGAYFKFSFDAKYEYIPGTPGGRPERCNQGVFFYDAKGRVLPDSYDTMYPDPDWRHYERVLYAWDEVEEFEVFFQKPWKMDEKAGDRCTMEISNVKIETATWEDAAAYADRVFAEISEKAPLDFKPEGDWTALIPRTMDALRTGKPWRVVMLGDSIIQDTFHSQFHSLVKRAFPESNVEWILSMRGGTGCWHYILAENFFPYVVSHKPDLLILGGISNGSPVRDLSGRALAPTGNEAMLRVAKAARDNLGCEVLIVNNPLSVDIRPWDEADPDKALPAMDFNIGWYEHMRGESNYARLRDACRSSQIQWWDETVPCHRWLFGSGLPHMYYSRDFVHSGELGKQIIGRIMLGYFLSGEQRGE